MFRKENKVENYCSKCCGYLIGKFLLKSSEEIALKGSNDVIKNTPDICAAFLSLFLTAISLISFSIENRILSGFTSAKRGLKKLYYEPFWSNPMKEI